LGLELRSEGRSGQWILVFGGHGGNWFRGNANGELHRRRHWIFGFG
jgi:hypothetical protein